ncbi:MAG: MscL family protein [Solirubrobacterales bacterium]
MVQSFADDILMNTIAALAGEPDFTDLSFTLGEGQIAYGKFLTVLVNFLIVGAALFAIVRLYERFERETPMTHDCPHCLSAIPRSASACPACTRDVVPAS